MRRRSILAGLVASRAAVSLALAFAWAACLAVPGAAAPLSSASFHFELGALPGFTFPGVGATGTATSQLAATLGGGTAFAGSFWTPVPTTAAPPIEDYQMIVTKNDAGTFSGTTPGAVGGNAAFHGVFNVYGIGGFPGGGAPLLAIPLEVGTPNTQFKSGGGVSITAIASAWTVGTAVVTGLPTTSAPTTISTRMGANGLTPGGGGTLVLVTPVKVLTNIAGALAAFGTLTLSYVPEPGTLALVGLGVAALAALGRRRT